MSFENTENSWDEIKQNNLYTEFWVKWIIFDSKL